MQQIDSERRVEQINAARRRPATKAMVIRIIAAEASRTAPNARLTADIGEQKQPARDDEASRGKTLRIDPSTYSGERMCDNGTTQFVYSGLNKVAQVFSEMGRSSKR